MCQRPTWATSRDATPKITTKVNNLNTQQWQNHLASESLAEKQNQWVVWVGTLRLWGGAALWVWESWEVLHSSSWSWCPGKSVACFWEPGEQVWALSMGRERLTAQLQLSGMKEAPHLLPQAPLLLSGSGWRYPCLRGNPVIKSVRPNTDLSPSTLPDSRNKDLTWASHGPGKVTSHKTTGLCIYMENIKLWGAAYVTPTPCMANLFAKSQLCGIFFHLYIVAWGTSQMTTWWDGQCTYVNESKTF